MYILVFYIITHLMLRYFTLLFIYESFSLRKEAYETYKNGNYDVATYY